EGLGAFLDVGVAATAVADEHTDAVAVFLVEIDARIFEGLAGGGDHELREARHAAGGFVFDELLRLPVLHFAGDLAGEFGGVDEPHGVDACAAVDQVVPELGAGLAGRGTGAESADYNASERPKRAVRH